MGSPLWEFSLPRRPNPPDPPTPEMPAPPPLLLVCSPGGQPLLVSRGSLRGAALTASKLVASFHQLHGRSTTNSLGVLEFGVGATVYSSLAVRVTETLTCYVCVVNAGSWRWLLLRHLSQVLLIHLRPELQAALRAHADRADEQEAGSTLADVIGQRSDAAPAEAGAAEGRVDVADDSKALLLSRSEPDARAAPRQSRQALLFLDLCALQPALAAYELDRAVSVTFGNQGEGFASGLGLGWAWAGAGC